MKPKIPPAPTIMYSGRKMALKVAPPTAGNSKDDCSSHPTVWLHLNGGSNEPQRKHIDK
jgi:hypothetical protein